MIEQHTWYAVKTWFLCEKDYNPGRYDYERWDMIEIAQIGWAKNNNQWKEEIKNFWNRYMPIVLSIDNQEGEVHFYAIDLKSEFGTIVYGRWYDTKSVEKIADTFYEFLELIMNGKLNS